MKWKENDKSESTEPEEKRKGIERKTKIKRRNTRFHLGSFLGSYDNESNG